MSARSTGSSGSTRSPSRTITFMPYSDQCILISPKKLSPFLRKAASAVPSLRRKPAATSPRSPQPALRRSNELSKPAGSVSPQQLVDSVRLSLIRAHSQAKLRGIADSDEDELGYDGCHATALDLAGDTSGSGMSSSSYWNIERSTSDSSNKQRSLRRSRR